MSNTIPSTNICRDAGAGVAPRRLPAPAHRSPPPRQGEHGPAYDAGRLRQAGWRLRRYSCFHGAAGATFATDGDEGYADELLDAYARKEDELIKKLKITQDKRPNVEGRQAGERRGPH